MTSSAAGEFMPGGSGVGEASAAAAGIHAAGDPLLRAVRAVSHENFEVLGDMGLSTSDRVTLLARELASTNLVALRLEPHGDDFQLDVMRALDESIPAAALRCPDCNATLQISVRFCPRCGADVSSVVMPAALVGTPGDALLDVVRDAARGTYEVLGEMPRADGAGSIFFARDLATGAIATLRLRRNAEPRQSASAYSLRVTSVVRPLVAAIAQPAPGALRQALAQPTPRRATPQEVLVPLSVPIAEEPPHVRRLPREVIAGGALATLVALGLAGYALWRGAAPDATRATATLAMSDARLRAAAVIPPNPLADSARIEVAADLPDQAHVTVDNVPLAAGIITVAPGRYTFRVTAPGFVTTTEQLTVKAGETLAWTPQLRRAGSARAAPPASRRRTASPATVTAPAAAMTPVAPTDMPTCAAMFNAKDWADAVSGCQREANGGSAPSARMLAILYQAGDGVTRDSVRAAAWFRRAAMLGDAEAQFQTGRAYERGLGVPVNLAEALAWYRKAAAQGNARAENYLGWLRGGGHGVPRDDAEAARWFQLAAAHGDAQAEYNLGFMYANGRGISRDESQAVFWYRRAARAGYHDAIEELKRRHLSP
jgi:hypothetical protein